MTSSLPLIAGPLIAGVDEAGRGPLAGPVAAAAVILPEGFSALDALDDSKKLTAKRRAALAAVIRAEAIVSVALAEPAEIDRLNVLHASLAAMARAVAGLSQKPDMILIDGNQLPPGLAAPARAIVGGDASEPAIAAASIIAKTTRDALMADADLRFPGYGFAGHKGYPSAAHRAALEALGPCPIHRLSYGPVQGALQARGFAQHAMNRA
ncbi:ribonuclease HII [Alkalicaulis satelles]|uniref:Ribonuclease HII n=1 Tax=Alkalicaulis satelles TaxID=2609175 RepID=A0A5M6ZKA1_9PROT|nr:ribonuclease HII [Alkalicaulis satelles]KAA5805239.1 ribonuclease HII [Alkalicaulis satelles]